MTAKTNQEWQTENSELKFRLKNLKQNFDKLSEEHKTLRTTLQREKDKTNNKCDNCKKHLDKESNVKKLRNFQKSKTVVFKCDKCEEEFSEKWKLRVHLKTHDKFKCEKCEKTFAYLDIKKKHVLISHENVKLYCHFYNNDKTCPFDDKCIFLHQDSKFCKYDEFCERDFCMFKHIKKNKADCDYMELEIENDIIDVRSDFGDETQEEELEEKEKTVSKQPQGRNS